MSILSLCRPIYLGLSFSISQGPCLPFDCLRDSWKASISCQYLGRPSKRKVSFEMPQGRLFLAREMRLLGRHLASTWRAVVILERPSLEGVLLGHPTKRQPGAAPHTTCRASFSPRNGFKTPPAGLKGTLLHAVDSKGL